uniref:Uncharacterized protein n=1 Tax=Arundo donax TaxID=35708 RepID=A0A0A9B5D3_ARUDO
MAGSSLVVKRSSWRPAAETTSWVAARPR